MSVIVKPVVSARDRARFIKMPWRIYEKDPHWVPPLIFEQKKFLDPKKGFFYETGEARLFMAYRDGRPVGRISAQINHRYDELYDDRKGFFGFFECEDDQEAADALFKTAEDHLRSRGRKLVEGPFSFSIYDEIGVLVDGFDSDPCVLCLHNPPYYDRLVENAGYGKSVDWYSYRGVKGKTDTLLSDRLKKLRDRIIKRRGLTVRQMEMAHFHRDSSIVFDLFNKAWDDNWGHVPLTEPQFRRMAEGIKQMIIPELSYIAEVGGKPVGFALSIIDANVVCKRIGGKLFPFGFIRVLREMKRTDRFRLMLMGVLDEHRNRGYEVAFYVNVIEQASKMNYREADISLVVENNTPMLSALTHLSVERYKTYRIYTKDLTN